MESYRFSVIDKAGSPPEIRFIHAADDIDARRTAMKLLRESPAVKSVVVWRGADIAFRLNQHQLHLEDGPARTRR
jgi:hypothetical protein